MSKKVLTYQFTSDRRYGKLIKYSSVFIHTSFAFLLLFEFLEAFFKKIKFDSTLRILVSTVCLTLFTFSIPYVAEILGDRRMAQYSFTKTQGASGLGLLIWLVVGGIFLFVANKNHTNILISYGIIFYIVSYFFLDFGARVFENIVPILMAVTVTDKRKRVRMLYIIFFMLYGGLQWYMQGGLNF